MSLRYLRFDIKLLLDAKFAYYLINHTGQEKPAKEFILYVQ